MRTGALIAAALLALVLCSCSGEKSQQENKKLADMESELSDVKGELAEVKDIADDLKAEVSAVKDETQALMQEEMQDQAAAETALLEAPAIPDHPVAAPDHPVGESE
jgi:septal ring factor EnvC (AmiA/AmiB activator)